MQDTLHQIQKYLEAIWRRRWLVILPTLLCAAVSVFMAATMPSYYRSTTTILVEQQQIPEEYVTPTNRTPFGQRLQTIRQQILSRPNLKNIINDFHLYSKKGDGGWISNAVSRITGRETNDPPAQEAIFEQMSKDIEVNVIGGQRGDAFSISYTGSDPYTVMQVTSTLASLFIEENLKVREQYAEGTSEFLTNELESAKKELDSQESSVRSFKEKFMGGLPQQLETNLRALDRLQLDIQNVRADIKSAEDRKILLESQLNQAASGSVQEAPGVFVDPVAAELTRLQHDLSALLANYNENYPDVITTRRRIDELKALLSKPKDKPKENSDNSLSRLSPEMRNPAAYNNLVTVKSQLAALRQREADIIKQIGFFDKRVENTPAIEQQFADLRRDYEISLRNYQTLLEKKLHAKLSENLEKRQKGERFTILDPANLPEQPFKPNRPAVALMGPLGGLSLGVALVLVLESLTPVFRTREELTADIDMPVLATVPLFASSKSAKNRKTPFRFSKRTHGHT